MTAPTALTQTQFNTIADSLGKAYNDGFLTLAATTEAGYLQTSAANVLTALLAVSDKKTVNQLLASVLTYSDFAAAPAATVQSGVASLLNTLRTNLATDFATWFDTFSPFNQISADFRALCIAAIGLTLSTKYVMPPQTTVAAMAVTGSGTGTLTGTGIIDIASYGPAQLEAVVTGGTIGAANIVATFTCVKYDGTTTTKSATITNGSTVSTAFAIGTTSDRFIDVSGITFTGGTNGDAFLVRSKVLRTPAL